MLCVVEVSADSHASVVYDVARVVMAMAQSTSGLLVMVAEMTHMALTTVAAVMVMPAVFTRCQSAPFQSTIRHRGTRRRVHRLLLALMDMDTVGILLVTLHSLVHYFIISQ